MLNDVSGMFKKKDAPPAPVDCDEFLDAVEEGLRLVEPRSAMEEPQFWSSMEEELFRWALVPAAELTPGNLMIYLDRHRGTERGPAALEAMIGRMLIAAKERGINIAPAKEDIQAIREKVNLLQEA